MLTYVFYFLLLFISYVNYFIALSTLIKATPESVRNPELPWHRTMVVGTTSKRFNIYAKPSLQMFSTFYFY